MDDLFLERAIEPLGDAVGLGLFDEGVGRLDAPELDLVGEVVRQILGAVLRKASPRAAPAEVRCQIRYFAETPSPWRCAFRDDTEQ